MHNSRAHAPATEQIATHGEVSYHTATKCKRLCKKIVKKKKHKAITTDKKAIISHFVYYNRGSNNFFFCLTLSWRRPLSYRNRSIDLLHNGLRHERVKRSFSWMSLQVPGSVLLSWTVSLFELQECTWWVYAQLPHP